MGITGLLTDASGGLSGPPYNNSDIPGEMPWNIGISKIRLWRIGIVEYWVIDSEKIYFK
jgi:hypothetical protein